MRKLEPGVNDLATKRPNLVTEWDYDRNYPLVPENIAYASGQKVWWICSSKKHQWFASIKNRSYGENCPFCFGFKPYIGRYISVKV